MYTTAFFKSKTIWGILIALLSTFLGKRGWVIDDTTQATILQWISDIGTLTGTALAIWGRVKATQPLSMAGGVVPKALPVTMLGFLMLAGCASSPAPATLTATTGASIAAYQTDMTNLVEAVITGYRADQQAQVDALYAAAVASHTDAKGQGDVAAIQGLNAIRAQKYADIEVECAAIRAKFTAANVNAANALTGVAALQGYFTNTANNAQLIQQTTDAAIQLLQAYLAKQAPAPATPMTKAVQAIPKTAVVPVVKSP
jgi:hypothetical protein